MKNKRTLALAFICGIASFSATLSECKSDCQTATEACEKLCKDHLQDYLQHKYNDVVEGFVKDKSLPLEVRKESGRVVFYKSTHVGEKGRSEKTCLDACQAGKEKCLELTKESEQKPKESGTESKL